MERKAFIATLIESHVEEQLWPAAKEVEHFLDHLLALLFPGFGDLELSDSAKVEDELRQSGLLLSTCLLSPTLPEGTQSTEIVAAFQFRLPEVYTLLCKDARAIEAGDPAAKSLGEVIRTYPGFLAIACYRVAHELVTLGVSFVPRIITEIAHSRTGIDIHPGARIGESFFIDHGTGVVIGETSIIGKQVKVYQGVTLGALSVQKDMASTKRHPTIEDHVVIYAGATILGGNTIIGSHSVVGGNAWITASVPPQSQVFHTPAITIKQRRNDVHID